MGYVEVGSDVIVTSTEKTLTKEMERILSIPLLKPHDKWKWEGSFIMYYRFAGGLETEILNIQIAGGFECKCLNPD